MYKTDVYRKSLNPKWNSDWFKFEADDLQLQDEPLQVNYMTHVSYYCTFFCKVRVMDYDTYSANDAIGRS